MSINLKPEIYISWIPRGQIEVKPEIYISWIPRGQVEVKPEIYASIIIAPHLENIVADTCRSVKNLDTSKADTVRKIGNAEKFQGDTCRKINKTENNFADTFRIVGNSEKIFADTSRAINFSEKVSGDTQRKVSNIEKIIADTLREVETNLAEIVADTLLVNGCSEKNFADSLREVVFAEKIVADTFREINQSTEIIADTFIRNACSEKVLADTKLDISNIEKISADTLRQMLSIERISADTERNIFEFISADTYRQVVKVERIVADTNKRIPHKLIYIIDTPLKKTTLKGTKFEDAPPLLNTFKDYGLTALNITLQEKTLSDTFQLETVQEMEINDAVTGKLLDYDFNFLVEETNSQDLRQSVKGMYDKDKLLYSQVKDSGVVKLTYEIDGEVIEQCGYEIYKKHIVKEIDKENSVVLANPTASDFINSIAGYLGYTSNIKIEDFTPENISGEIDITYANLLSNVFGWTSQVPQRQINVFIRGGVLHCIQRGMEESVFEISDLPHSRPIVNKKLLRTMWQSQSNTNDDDDDDNAIPFTGTIQFSPRVGTSNTLQYQNGFLVKEISQTSTEERRIFSTTDYSYLKHLDDGEVSTYLSSKITKITTEIFAEDNQQKIIESKDSYYNYKTFGREFYLLAEIEVTNRETYEPDSEKSGTYFTAWKLSESETIKRETYHTPLGNGWYGQAVFENGVIVGSNLSQGKPGNSVSPFTISHFQTIFNAVIIKDNENNPLKPVDDKEFPVVEKDVKNACAEAYEWLNRKVQETVSVDIIDNIFKGIPSLLHIIDFTERIKLDGKEYFLVSNNISFTPKQFVQRLNLIRWY